jgi:hypothetical protein
MALLYYLYQTNSGNTVIDRSETSFAPLPPNTGELQYDILIPETQPLYYYRESGSTIVPNDDATIQLFKETIYPPTDDDKVSYETFTAYTNTNNTRVTNVETAIITVDNNVTFVSGATDQNTADITSVSGQTSGNAVAIEAQQNQFTGYTAATATKRILVVNNTIQDLNTIAGVNIQWDIILRQDSDYFGFTAGTDTIEILETGAYDVAMSVPMDYAGGGNQINNVGITLLINGVTDVDTYISATVNKDRQQTATLAGVQHDFTAGDLVQVEGYSLNGATQAVTVAGSVWFQITKVNA